jgi:ribosomal protein S18 acetylase RimI-like enzyme
MVQSNLVPSEIKIRNFTIKDYDQLIELWKKANLPFKPEGRDSKEKLLKELDHGFSIFFVAEYQGELLGSVFGTHDGRKGWINRLVVSPEIQQQGLAKRLVDELETKVYSLGIEIIACLVEDWNKSSMQVFEKLGYQKHTDIFYFTKRKHPEV